MENKLVIIYQLGKVGSTSLVKSLNSLENVTAYQSHFLGNHAFSGMLKILLDPNTSDYFFEHNLGQLVQNTKIQREINLQAKKGEAVYFLSLAREPIEWYRSAVSQDLRGTLGGLCEFAEENGHGHEPLSYTIDVVKRELLRLFSLMSDEEQRCISTPAVVRESHIELKKQYGMLGDVIYRQVLIFFRPFSWFEEHFYEFTGVEVSIDKNDVFCKKMNQFNYLVARYEDYRDIGALILKYWNIEIEEIEHQNKSQSKKGAQRIKELISIWNKDPELIGYLSRTEYCKKFKYYL